MIFFRSSHSTTVRRRFSRSLLLSAALGAAVALASPQPVQAGLLSISAREEQRMGDEAAREIESQVRLVRGPVADWVQAVGARLAAVSKSEFKYSFKVIDRPEVNAFALPGGHVYVFSGLRKVAQTDDELAAILSHEITHAEEHHFARQYKKAARRGALLGIFSAVVGLPNLAQQVVGLIDFSMTQKYSRTHEFEADHRGMERMARAGFNPQGMVSLLSKLAKEDPSSSRLDKWFGSHPDSPKRVQAAQQMNAQVRALQMQGNAAVRPVFAPWTPDTLRALSGGVGESEISVDNSNGDAEAAP